ncbi:MAG: UDP-3-O-(3-hydroxymyristoyl)glucosamine N-acyltransferase [Pseudomonadota bacterium]
MVDDRFFARTSFRTLKDLCELPQIAKLIMPENDMSSHIDQDISSINILNKAQKGELAFFDNPKYKQDFTESAASFLIAKPEYADICPASACMIRTQKPYHLYALCASYLYKDRTESISPLSDYQQDQYGAYIHKDAQLEDDVQTSINVVIHAGAEIGAGTIISSGSVIGAGVAIGRYARISANVSLSHCLIGDHVHIHSGVVIGSPGFGYALGQEHISVPQLGRVILQDHVHIGAGTTIDRGAIDDTIIGEGSKIDNLVQIGHNVVMGIGCVVAGQCAIAGSVTFGDYVVCGGQTCVAGHLKIGSGARIAGGAGVSKDIPDGETWSGLPAKPRRQNLKELAILTRAAKQRSEV